MFQMNFIFLFNFITLIKFFSGYDASFMDCISVIKANIPFGAISKCCLGGYGKLLIAGYKVVSIISKLCVEHRF